MVVATVDRCVRSDAGAIEGRGEDSDSPLVVADPMPEWNARGGVSDSTFESGTLGSV
jgi:hypothetical protein